MLRSFGLNVGHKDEVWQQFAVGGVDREVLLVTFHGVHQRFGWYGQEFLFELSSQHHWPFHQRGDFFQQAFADVSFTAQLSRRLLGITQDQCFTLGVVSNHFTALAQQLWVLLGVLDFKLGFAHEAVAANDAIRVDPQNGARNQLVIQQQGDGVHWTDKVSALVAPTHWLWHWQFGQRAVDHVAQQLFGWTAGDYGTVQQPFAFIGHHTLGLVDGDPATARPAFSGFGRLTIRAKCLSNRRAAFFNLLIRLGFLQVDHFQRQTTRRSKPLHWAVRQIGFIQLGSEVSGKSFGQCAQGFWWQLFGTDFYQKGRLLRHIISPLLGEFHADT